jgi:hypothetical protein
MELVPPPMCAVEQTSRLDPHTTTMPLIWSDLSQLIGAIFLILGAVLPVVNPLGDAPIF